jgi:D-alanyl-D-alanine carboxypeptidase
MSTQHASRLLLLLLVLCYAGGAGAQGAPVTAQLQQTLDSYLTQRGVPESITGVSLYVSLGDPGPAIEVYSGSNGRRKNKAPIDGDTLFQIGSNTKHFEAAVILKLEAEGKLSISQTIGDWLPEYPAWSAVTIRQLLNMTSPIPNYSETVTIGKVMAEDIHHQFTKRQLIDAVYPGPGNQLPIPSGWFYSNTNNIIAALIIEKASGRSFAQWLDEVIFPDVGLHSTYYSEGPYPHEVLERLPRGVYENQACLAYQPMPCQESVLAPLIGRDTSAMNLSWAGAAGAIISTPRDLAKWIRALFGGRVIPQQQLDEMMTVVSQRTGQPVPSATADDPAFGLDLVQQYSAETGGTFWFYEGSTLGFRAIFAYWPQYNLVMTTSTNSQPPEGEDQLGSQVLLGAFDVLAKAGMLTPTPPVGPATLPGSDPD